ncbi:hypothetical protein B0J14DRAFT_608939 [Halenospora varia]|nr:hypothetical protein B0J14DRAFT_608939 [Halenospora varia]
MSCKRADKANLIGCRIGDVALRGCSWGCCSYPDSEISENTRPYLLQGSVAARQWSGKSRPRGRTGLYYYSCQSSYRPKFICPEKECRRSIKPFYDPDKFEYRISEWQDWSVRPRIDRCPELKQAYRNKHRINSTGQRNSEETLKFKNLWERLIRDSTSLTEEELAYVKEREPEEWWTEIAATPQVYREDAGHLMRCPSCGKGALAVGSNFRIPAKKDERGWKKVEKMIEDGEDMVAKFSPCATFEEHEKMVERARELRAENVVTS